MKIYFSASTEKISDHIATYRLIRDTLLKSGNNITRDWIEDAFKDITLKGRYNESESNKILTKVRESIANCDVAIFESTIQSFGVGYQTALSISLQKPTLILQKHSARPLGVTGIGVNSALKSYVTYYSDEQLKSSIINFLEENNISTKALRFNMVLERDLLYFLSNESEETGLSKSQIVRNLIRDEAKRKSESI